MALRTETPSFVGPYSRGAMLPHEALQIQLGSTTLEIPASAAPAVPDGTVLTLHCLPNGRPDYWAMDVASAPKILGIDRASFQESLRPFPTLETGQTVDWLHHLLSLPLLMHRSVEKLLNGTNGVRYADMRGDSYTSDGDERQRQRRQILQNPAFSAFLQTLGWPSVSLLLQSRYGLSAREAQHVRQSLNFSTMRLMTSPYLGAYALDGHQIPFALYEAMADTHGPDNRMTDRIRAALFWRIQALTFNQNTIIFTPDRVKQLAEKTLAAYGQAHPASAFAQALQAGSPRHLLDDAWKTLVHTHYVWEHAAADGRTIAAVGRIHRALQWTGTHAATLLSEDPVTPPVALDALTQSLTLPPYALSADQVAVIPELLTHALSFLLGAPGRGKTRMVASLTLALARADATLRMWVLAPTARAAVRVRQATQVLANTDAHSTIPPNVEFMTVHHALHMSPTYDGSAAAEAFPDLLIVDEASMLDGLLTHALLRQAADSHTQVIFVGDPAQLPPVGPGRILRTILNKAQDLSTTAIQTITTDYRRIHNPINPAVESLNALIYRQDGLRPDPAYAALDPAHQTQADAEVLSAVFQQLEAAHTVQWHKTLSTDTFPRVLLDSLERVRSRFPEHDPFILTPYRHTHAMLGATGLNRYIHEWMTKTPTLQPGEPIILKENGEYARADHTDFLYLPNGTLGHVLSASRRSPYIVVEVDDPEQITQSVAIALHVGDYGQRFDLGYATTVHAAQGGQAPAVILIGSLTDHTPSEWDPHMLYTALSRLQDLDGAHLGQLVILGDLHVKRHQGHPSDGIIRSGWNKGMARPTTSSSDGANP